MLKSLRGAASDDAEGDWRVNTARLQEAVAHFMAQERFAGEVAGVQVPVAGQLPVFELHRLRGDPVVPVYIGCRPQRDNALAELVCMQDGNVLGKRSAAEADPNDPECDWVIDLQFGHYDSEARFEAAPARTKVMDVRPTYRRVPLEAGT